MNGRFKKIVFSVLACTMSFATWAQTGYKIDFKVEGWKDTTVYLGYYQMGGTYLKDTARVNSKGMFSFDGDKALLQGVYFTVLDKTRIFDFVVGQSQHFSMQTSSQDYIQNMVVKGDQDNQLFFDNIRYNIARNKEAEPFVKVVRDSLLTDAQKKEAREMLGKINEKVMARQDSLQVIYPTALTTRMLKMHAPVKVPDAPILENGRVDSTFQYRYYKQHYFDNLNLADDALLRVPTIVYWDKVKEYLDKLFIQQPDTLTKAINDLVAVAKSNKETYKYLVWKCMLHYQENPIMGLDEVYVNLFDQYFATGEMDFWIDKKTVQNMRDYANKLRKAMIGRTAPNLMMQDENLDAKALYDIKRKYTVLYFFNPDCGHCKKETPKLVKLYNDKRNELDFEVFAVSTDSSMVDMRKFIKDMNTTWITVNGPRTYFSQHFSELYQADTTPMIYIIDNKRKIIARKLGVDQIEDFLGRYDRAQKLNPKP